MLRQDFKSMGISIAELLRQTDVNKLRQEENYNNTAQEIARRLNGPQPALLFKFLTSKPSKDLPDHEYFHYTKLGVHLMFEITDDPKWLIKIAVSKRAEWYVRQEALKCLEVTTGPIDWKKVSKIISKTSEEIEVIRAALDLISAHNRTEFVPQLCRLGPGLDEEDYFQSEIHNALIMARGKLGDIYATSDLLKLCNNPWASKSQSAQKAWDILSVKNGGAASVARHLCKDAGLSIEHNNTVWMALQQHPQTEIVKWSLSEAPLCEAQIATCLTFLGHDDAMIREASSLWLAQHKVDPDRVLAVLNDKTETRLSQSWAIYTAIRINPKVKLPIVDPDVLRVPWSEDISSDIRASIINEYLPSCEAGTDVRYKIEWAQNETPIYDAMNEDRNALIEALNTEGLVIESVKSIGECHSQGGGSYWVIQIKNDDPWLYLNVSTLGKYIIFGQESALDFTSNPSNTEIELHPKLKRSRDIALGLGLAWLDPNVLQKICPGLNVYFFGHREPLSYYDLLFYWQD